MSELKKLQSALDALHSQRSQVAGAGWALQHCWLVQVKPGGTARTDCKYWQVRSRQPLFGGKTLKHLKPDEVEDYRAAIERGRQLKRIDHQIEKLQQRLAQLIPTTDSSSGSSESSSAAHEPLNLVKFTDLAEQEQLVKEVLANSQALRASLRRSVALAKQLETRKINLRRGHPHVD